jgi:T5orf172 domain
MATGFVYVLINKAMPGLVKVGFSTRSPEERAAELSTTGVPFPFAVAFSAEVENPIEAEATVHSALARHRTSVDREFFRMSVEDAVAAVEDACQLGGSPISSDCDLSPGSGSTNSWYHKEAQKYYPKKVSFFLATEPQTWFPARNLSVARAGEVRCPYCEQKFMEPVSEASMFLPPLTVQCRSCRRTIFLR